MTSTAGNSARGASVAALLATGALLLALAALSFGLSFAQLGVLALPLALLIALGKALTVVFAFMEFGRVPASAKLLVLSALLMFALLLGLMLADVGTRGPPPLAAPTGREARSAQAIR